MRKDLHLAYWKGDIYAVVRHDFGAVSPDIVEQVKHDPDRFVPYQSSISLEVILIKGQLRHPVVPVRTSEKAGAVIARYLFHSSPSEATMFRPKTSSGTYISTGLGNLAR